jgi:hypothetical protein
MEGLEIKKKIYKELPIYIKSILLNNSGYLVGSAISRMIKGEIIKDYDIIIPDREMYMAAVRSLTSISRAEHQINTFGGMKFYVGEAVVIDIWCEELDHFITNATKQDYIYNMKRSLLIQIF